LLLGFGNKPTDSAAYLHCGLPPQLIFEISPSAHLDIGVDGAEIRPKGFQSYADCELPDWIVGHCPELRKQ
jgi:hypothetical protein